MVEANVINEAWRVGEIKFSPGSSYYFPNKQTNPWLKMRFSQIL
jgi:hypothetical protein